MRDTGLEAAIQAVGGVGALARALGIAQPSVSAWKKIPAERVLAVESLSGVPRTRLRPDLYPSESGSMPAPDEPAIDEIDRLRGWEYAMFATLLGRTPDAAVLAAVAGLTGDDSPLGLAHRALAAAARMADPETVADEYFRLFIGVGGGEIQPYGSYYLAGFLHERPLARLRSDLAALGIARSPTWFEPEDHLGILCEVMALLAGGQVAGGLEAQQRIFARHIAPWAGRCCADIAAAAAADFYRPVARAAAAFFDIEAQAFALDTVATGGEQTT